MNDMVISLRDSSYGLMGKVKHVDVKKDMIVVKFNREDEAKKLQDPFISTSALNSQDIRKLSNARRFFTGQEIEKEMGLAPGFVGKFTGSFNVSYNCTTTHERKLVDIGLNIKNMAKQ